MMNTNHYTSVILDTTVQNRRAKPSLALGLFTALVLLGCGDEISPTKSSIPGVPCISTMDEQANCDRSTSMMDSPSRQLPDDNSDTTERQYESDNLGAAREVDVDALPPETPDSTDDLPRLVPSLRPSDLNVGQASISRSRLRIGSG